MLASHTFFFEEGHTQWLSGGYFLSLQSESTPRRLWDYIGFWGSNPAQSYARQMSNPRCKCSSPTTLMIFILQSKRSFQFYTLSCPFPPEISSQSSSLTSSGIQYCLFNMVYKFLCDFSLRLTTCNFSSAILKYLLLQELVIFNHLWTFNLPDFHPLLSSFTRKVLITLRFLIQSYVRHKSLSGLLLLIFTLQTVVEC